MSLVPPRLPSNAGTVFVVNPVSRFGTFPLGELPGEAFGSVGIPGSVHVTLGDFLVLRVSFGNLETPFLLPLAHANIAIAPLIRVSGLLRRSIRENPIVIDYIIRRD